MSSVLDRDDQAHLLRIGDLARMTGKSVRAIHLYEELGLLTPRTRSSGGFRLFDPSAAEQLRWIELLHGLGFSLQEMRNLRRSWWSNELGPEAMEHLRELFVRKLEETRDTVRRYQQLESELEQGLSYLQTCRACATPAEVAACVHCDQDHGMTSRPALVAGITSAPERARKRSGPGFVRIEDIE